MQKSSFFPLPLAPLRLVDIALTLAMFPLLFVMKLPVLIFTAATLLLLVVKRKVSKTLLSFWMLFGVGMIMIAFIGEFDYVGLSRLSVYVSLLISLLVYAIMLQRLTREINPYLLVSPGLLLILSFFFFNSVTMLFYALGVLFIFVLLLLWQKMQSPLIEAFRMSLLLFSMALPAVVLLFLVFPRISFEKSDFGFKGDTVARTGHDGTMNLGAKALLVPSERVVMEVLFDTVIPPNELLYFRGSVLYRDGKEQWYAAQHVGYKTDENLLSSVQETVAYHITLYPHFKRWIYMLDLPTNHPKNTAINQDYITKYIKNIDEIFRYEGVSVLKYHTAEATPQSKMLALQVDRSRYPLSDAAARKIVKRYPDLKERAGAIVALFKQQDLTYTLQPNPMDTEHLSDAFLFGSRSGYCVHYAASFTVMARLSGIAARIVTGFKGDRKNSVANFLILREKDAHAWVELYLPPRGWVRFDPTATASHLDASTTQNMQNQKSFWEESRLYFMYVKHIIATWVLEYSRFKQMNLLHTLLNDTLFLAKFIGAFVLLLFLSAAGFVLLQRQRCEDAALCAMRPLFKALAKKGLIKQKYETMDAFLTRADAIVHHRELLIINRYYHLVRYAQQNDKENLIRLKQAIRSFR